jgi:hypothetical protein
MGRPNAHSPKGDPMSCVPSPMANYDKPSYPWCVRRYHDGITHPEFIKNSERKSYTAAADLADRLNTDANEQPIIIRVIAVTGKLF